MRYSQITGVKNTIKGTSEASETVSASGLDNTVEDSSKVFVVGNNRPVKSSSDTIAVGFNSSDSAAITTTAKQAVILGSDANVTKDGGVALGYKSIASTTAGVTGYDPETGAASTKTDATWTSTAGAVSIGADNYTRQITGVAAGTQDTDAVNVAQLKAALTKAMSNSSGNNGGNTGGDTGNAKTVKVTSSDKNLTVTPTETDTETTYDLALNNDKLTLGTDTSKNQVVIEGNSNTITVSTGANQVEIDGGSGNVSIGSNISMNAQTGGANFGKVTINEGNKATIGVLSNTTWNPNNYVSGQAATEDQLYQATQAQNNQYRELKRDIADLDDDIRDAGAAAAALAGLKPIQYDPVQPTQLMAAIGGYRGSVALSLGIGHYTSERMLWHAGVAMNEHPMFNVGFTFKFGNRNLKDANDREYPIHDRYKAGPITASYVMQRDLSGDLDQHNGLIDDVNALKAKDAKVEALEAEVAQLREELKEFKELLKKGKVK